MLQDKAAGWTSLETGKLSTPVDLFISLKEINLTLSLY